VTRTLLLVLHISAVAGWLGANFVQLVLSPRFAKGLTESAAAWTRQTIWLGQRYYGPVGAVVGVTGVLLVFDGDWSWSSGFVWVGVVAFVIGATLGVAVFGPLAERRATALESGAGAGAGPARIQSRIIGFALVDTAVITVALAAMVHKWQA